ncbi:DUF982 domain-containing protein [Mesorhizobium sp. M7A.F.Ca.US.006.01.1.1]|uniref:DUF982 domain-containing protein n=1 Tax=Mesorhizobium sp. M7A.F.Ca.US.006.01.1.1 TaxID=2496707 RepID=UPI000FCAC61C|nr:DUF982 domain-containing protein [Mesorhizobium sp. M7A.F.Ca.US.006.01.1.1]RUZ81261.1 DUF982 domain-containing protein [Mesorhizobium sp. M7A.F.Ca.US.006.01.1.1]
MPLHWFNPPVYVRTDRPGIRFGVSHVEGASEQLLKWTKRGPKWKQAVETCMAAMEGNVPTQEVRRAFEAAAKEESMLLPPS